MNPEDRLKQMLSRAKGEDRVTESKWNEFATSARRSVRIQRFAMAGLAVFLLGAGAVGAATLLGDSGPGRPMQPANPSNEGTVESPDTSPTTLPSPDPSEFPPPPDPVTTPVEVWLVDPETDKLSWGYRIETIQRDVLLQEVIAILLEGPSSPDVEAGVETAIPEDTELIDSKVKNGIATLTLSEDFLEGYEDTAKSLELREAQVVYTATQVEGVDEVEILIDGAPYPHMGSFFSRSTYDDVAPAIVVDEPKIGSEHSSPLVVSGTANVFEATVSMELEIGKGSTTETVGTFATATCGSGCRGEFSTELSFNVDKPTDGVLTVYEESAEDGSRLHSVQLPLRLLPSD